MTTKETIERYSTIKNDRLRRFAIVKILDTCQELYGINGSPVPSNMTVSYGNLEKYYYTPEGESLTMRYVNRKINGDYLW